MPAGPSIQSLIRLLDDPTDEVQTAVKSALLTFQGDASQDLKSLGINLPKKESRLLSRALRQGRREALLENWAIPTGPITVADGSLEALLHTLSDFLHDGISFRPCLADQLDRLAEKMAPKVVHPVELAQELFYNHRLHWNKENPLDARNSDLAWSLSNFKSNALGLALIFMLVADRLNMAVHGINFPGHFLTCIEDSTGLLIIDPAQLGRTTPLATLLRNHPELSPPAVFALKNPCSGKSILLRLLNNLKIAFTQDQETADLHLIDQLILTIKP